MGWLELMTAQYMQSRRHQVGNSVRSSLKFFRKLYTCTWIVSIDTFDFDNSGAAQYMLILTLTSWLVVTFRMLQNSFHNRLLICDGVKTAKLYDMNRLRNLDEMSELSDCESNAEASLLETFQPHGREGGNITAAVDCRQIQVNHLQSLSLLPQWYGDR